MASARLAIPEFWPEVDTGAEPDYAALRLQALRKRGSGINLRNRPPTTARAARILRLLGLSPAKHTVWCGLPMKEWIKTNPTWSEAEWAELVAQNFDTIKQEDVLP